MRGEGKRLRPRERNARLAPYLVFGVAVIATAIMWRIAESSIQQRELTRFSASIKRAQNAIQNRVQRQADLLRSTAAMLGSGRAVSLGDFQRFYLAAAATGYSGMSGLGVSLRLPAGQESQWVQKFRTGPAPDLLAPLPESERTKPKRDAIVFLEPDGSPHNFSIGSDMAVDPSCREAMEYSEQWSRPAISGTVAGSGKDPVFILYYPLFGGARDKVTGYVFSEFQAKRLVESALRESELDVACAVFDGTDTDADRQIYNNVPSDAGRYNQVVTCPLPGHAWTVRYVTMPAFDATSDRILVQAIPIIGFVVSLLLGALSLSQARGTRALELNAIELHRRAYQQRMLAQTGAILTASLNVDRTLGDVAHMVVPSFADWCVIDLVNPDGSLRRVATAHIDPRKVRRVKEVSQKYPPDPNATYGVPEVVRTGKAELHRQISKDLLKSAARDEEHARLLEEIGITSAIVVPMVVRENVLGAITFVWAESGLQYDQDDLRLAEEMGKRAGAAIETGLLFEEKQSELEERRRAEQQVRELNDNLERLVKERTAELEASNHELEAFCYAVSHDLRTPLRSVDGFSRAIIEDYGDVLKGEGIGYLDRVRAAARRMDELITALLSLSRLTRAEIHRSDIDLSAMALEAANEAARAAGVHPFVIQVEDGLRTEADSRMARIVLDNLIANALKFSAKSPDQSVEVGRDGDAFYVRDNGVGFNPEYANKLFIPFERLHSAVEYPGSGIGLATVQRIIARHGGRVWAESQEGQGATFYFRFE